jgi:hypothetical protein
MELVHQLITHGITRAEYDHIWCRHWHHIASAKVDLETKIATYQLLKVRGVVDINGSSIMGIYAMVIADRAFVSKLEMNDYTSYLYRVCVILFDDDVTELAKLDLKGEGTDPTTGFHHSLKYIIPCCALTKNDAPRCTRFLLQDEDFRRRVMWEHMSPLVQRLAEELVQPTDQVDKWQLLIHSQSVKLIGMCVKDEELVAEWLPRFRIYAAGCHVWPSVMLARKLHALATPAQRVGIATELFRRIPFTDSDEGCFEMTWLFGLVNPFIPPVQNHFLKHNVSLFPAFTFAMIVAKCDGYLEFARSGITWSQRRFFTLVGRLPRDLQALVALQLWERTSTVIRSDEFDRAFLAVI